jgi:hypothetical protein
MGLSEYLAKHLNLFWQTGTAGTCLHWCFHRTILHGPREIGMTVRTGKSVDQAAVPRNRIVVDGRIASVAEDHGAIDE